MMEWFNFMSYLKDREIEERIEELRVGKLGKWPGACNSSSHWNRQLKRPTSCPHRFDRHRVLWKKWMLRRVTGEYRGGHRRRGWWGWRGERGSENGPWWVWNWRRRIRVGWNERVRVSPSLNYNFIVFI